MGALAPPLVQTGKRANSRRIALWAAVIAGFVFAVWLGHQVRTDLHGIDDFNSFYVGAMFARDGHLYDVASIPAAQRATIGTERSFLLHPRLPFYYWMLSPMANLPYRSAYRVWSWTMIAAAILFPFVYPAANRAALIAGAAVSVPLMSAIGEQQDVALMLLIFSIGMLLHARGRMLAAGLVLSLVSIKFHWFLLLPIPLLVHRQWRVLAGFGAGGAALAALSFAVAGRDWIHRWYFQMILHPSGNVGLENMPNLNGVLEGVPGGRAIMIVLGAAVVVMVWIAARRVRFELAVAAAVLGGFLLSGHSYTHDCAILIPGLVEIAWTRREWLTRALAVSLLTPFPYFLPALLVNMRHGIVPAALIMGTLAAVTMRESATPAIAS